MKKNKDFSINNKKMYVDAVKKTASLLALFPEIECESFNQDKRKQIVELLMYLQKIKVLPRAYTISYYKERTDYADFPLGVANILDTVNIVKNYLDLVRVDVENNKPESIDLVQKMYNKNSKALDVFYYFFSVFLKNDNNITRESVKEQLLKAIQEASAFFFEKDVSVAIAYLMKILRLGDSLVDSNDSQYFYRICYQSVKKNILEIVSEMPGNGDGRGNVYFDQNLFYEIAMMENDLKGKTLFFNGFLDMLNNEEASLYAGYSKETRLANYPYILNMKVLLEVIKESLDGSDATRLYRYINKIKILLFSPFEAKNFNAISFDRCSESYHYFIGEIENLIQYYNIEKFNDVESLSLLCLVLHNFSYSISVIDNFSKNFYRWAMSKELFRMELTEFQQEQLDKIKDLLLVSPLAENSLVKDLRTNIEHMYRSDHYALSHLSKKTNEIQSKTKKLLSKTTLVLDEAKTKYSIFLHRYIENFISETVDPSEVLIKSDDCSKVIFQLSKNNVPRLFKIYSDVFQMKDGNIHLNLVKCPLPLVTIDDILNQVINACCDKKNRSLANQVRPTFNNSTFEKKSDEKKLEQEDVSIETQFRNTLLFDTPMAPADDNELLTPVKRKVKRSHMIDEVEDKNKINLNIATKSDKQERYSSALNEARQSLLPKDVTDKSPKCPYILNTVHSKSERKNPLIIALNKSLKLFGTTHTIPENEQKKIYDFIQDISLVREKGQDGIKYCDGVYVLKLRNVEGKSYRAIAKEKKMESGAVVLMFDFVTNKTHAHKPLRQAIQAKRKRKRK